MFLLSKNWFSANLKITKDEIVKSVNNQYHKKLDMLKSILQDLIIHKLTMNLTKIKKIKNNLNIEYF